jgi:hypothetical protein
MFSYPSSHAFMPLDHPLHAIRPMGNAPLDRLLGDFAWMYSDYVWESIASEKLLRAPPLRALFSIRSERQLMEQVTYKIMFRWFVGLSIDAAVWDVTIFTKNRDRLLDGDIARDFPLAVLADPQVKPLLSDQHFSVDGTMLEVWASMKSFQPKDGSGPAIELGRKGEVDLSGPPRSNETHACTTDAGCPRYK